MMNTLPKICLAATLLSGVIGTSAASAEEPPYTPAFTACLNASGGATPDILDCIDAETKVWDKALNDAYKRTMSALPEARRFGLQAAQRAWIKFRDASCAFMNDPDGGQEARMVVGECELRMTAGRANEVASFAE